MKSLATISSLAVALAVALGTAACAPSTNPNRPTDTGNMAFPAPVPQGNIGTTSPMTPDTGNMALPNRAQGNSRPGSY